jgi:hypothetical protein
MTMTENPLRRARVARRALLITQDSPGRCVRGAAPRFPVA